MINDEELLKNIAKGDSKAFELLFNRHKKSVYGLSLRILGSPPLAEENAQETWIKVVEFAKNFELRASVLSWIQKIAKNQALNILRKRGWEEELPFDSQDSIADETLSSFEALEQTEDLAMLKSAVDSLPDRQRVALVLWMHEEKSYSELAQEMNLNVNAVKVLLFRAKENVQKFLKKGGS